MKEFRLEAKGVVSFQVAANKFADSATDLLQATKDFHELLSLVFSVTFWTHSTYRTLLDTIAMALPNKAVIGFDNFLVICNGMLVHAIESVTCIKALTDDRSALETMRHLRRHSVECGVIVKSFKQLAKLTNAAEMVSAKREI